MITVHELSNLYDSSYIGKKYNVTGMYGSDILTVVGKEKGFGIMFHSKLTEKDHYVDDHLYLKEIQ